MKKILVIHNKYKLLGGEDIAVQSEIEILRKNFDVRTLIFDNKNIDLFSDIFSFVFNRNPKSLKKLKEEIKDFKPEIVYVHNTWYKASVAILDELKKLNLKTFIKLHNFRYDCTRHFLAKNHFKKSEICEKCGASKLSLINKYFTESIFKTFLVLRYGKKYFSLIKENNFNLIVLTAFHKSYLESLGINKENIYTIHNPFKIDTAINENSENYIIYAGRISEEKGVEELIKAFLKSDLNEISLKIIGEGPKLDYLINKYKINKNIELLGAKNNSQTKQLISSARAVVTATKLLEGQPTLLCEASSLGVPSIFPKFGGIYEFFPRDVTLSFEQYNYDDLSLKLNELNNEEKMLSEGKKNREYLLNNYGVKSYIAKFIEAINE